MPRSDERDLAALLGCDAILVREVDGMHGFRAAGMVEGRSSTLGFGDAGPASSAHVALRGFRSRAEAGCRRVLSGSLVIGCGACRVVVGLWLFGARVVR